MQMFGDAKQPPQPEKVCPFPGCPDSPEVFAVHFVVHLAKRRSPRSRLTEHHKFICGELR
jgi:hypothetical protein